MIQSRQQFLTAAAASMTSAALPSMGRAQARRVVRMAGVFSDLFGEPFFAKDAGAFARRGFDVEVSNMENVGAVLAAMAGGSLDMGVADIILGVKAIIGGAPVTIIANSGLYLASQPTAILAVLPDSPVRTAKDLIGKTVGVPTLGALTASTLLAWLPQHGVESAQVKLVEVPQAVCVPAMQRGTISAALLGEPFIAANKGRIRSIAHPYDVIANEFPVSVWYAAKSWIEADPPRARDAVAAIVETSRWANAHRTDSMNILIREGHFDPEVAKNMIRTTFATSLTAAQVQPTLDFCTQYKIFNRHIDAASVVTEL